MTLPFDLAKYPIVETIRLLASLLERMTAANDQLHRASLSRNDIRRSSSASPLNSQAVTFSNRPESCTRFHARSIPSIDILSYLTRILKYCPCANECFLSLLVYFDRMSKNSLTLTGKPFTIDSYNIHRLIISGVMVSSKFFSDVFYTNTRYAKVGGLPVSELNSLELEFLRLNGFNVTVPISELQRYGDQLLKVGYMEQKIRKNMTLGQIRHGRSTSLGSNVLVRQDVEYQRRSLDQQSVDRICDATSRISLDESDQGHGVMTSSFCQFFPSSQPATTPTGAQHSPRTYRTRVDSHPQLHTFTSSPVETNKTTALYKRYSDYQISPTRVYQRGSFGIPVALPTCQSPVTMDNLNNSQVPSDHWKVPRQSRSSINLQQSVMASSRDESIGNGQSSTSGNTRRLSLTSIHAPPFIHQRPPPPTSEILNGQYGYYTVAFHSLPTPPPSISSPDHKQRSPTTSAVPQQPYPVIYL